MRIKPFPPINDMYLPTIIYRFLLVSLNIEAVLGGVTIGQGRKKLEGMARGNGLSDAYTSTLKRLKTQKGGESELGLKVLMWVLHSEQPLHADDLCHALGVEIGPVDLDRKSVPALKKVLSSCIGLVMVEVSSSTIRLVHFTLQEHLANDPTLFCNPHVTIAEVCLTYLNFRCIRDLAPEDISGPSPYFGLGYPGASSIPLLEYSSRYWGEHARRGMTENVKVQPLDKSVRDVSDLSA